MDNLTEWLEADGLGGFASGTTSAQRSRRYHALLLTAMHPPTGRMVLVNGFDAWVQTTAGRFAISSQRYEPDVVWPDGASRIIDFQREPWPAWTYRLPEGLSIAQELFVPHGISACCLRWRLLRSPSGRGAAGEGEAKLELRPFLSGRDYHATHHENPAFHFDTANHDGWLRWHPYDGVSEILALTNGQYRHDPEWFRNFLYEFEKERGLDFLEDLASPGTLTFDLSHPAVLIFAAEGHDAAINKLAAPLYPDYSPNSSASVNADANAIWERLAQSELARRQKFATPLHRAADAYLVGRGAGQTLIAGYPWFTDWGRDTFISLRGLCLAIGRFDEAKQILLAWSQTVSEGMLPNRFPDAGSELEFNSVDASLWFVVAVHDLIDAAARQNRTLAVGERRQLEQAVLAIVEGYSRGTRFGIRMDGDGLLAAGEPGTQLTWMDARVGDHTITPRVGKPVEVQALWLNALWIAGRIDRRWNAVFERGRSEFELRFWNAALDCLFDVVDVDHQSGAVDASMRPSQIFAIGGLPLALLHGPRARNVVDAVEFGARRGPPESTQRESLDPAASVTGARRGSPDPAAFATGAGRGSPDPAASAGLLTPLGLRTLSPGSPGYAPQCVGPPEQRDAAYHQGTVWPWLMGPFVEAWLRVRGGTAVAKQQALHRFLPPLSKHLESAGLGHISEIADADPPFTPRGCPFQAWSLGEFLRLKYNVLRVDD